MKVLTIKQPWAYLIAAGIKDIENRTWKCPEKYIGKRVLIHASAMPVSNGKCISHWLNEEQYRHIAFTTHPNKQLDTCFLKHYNSAIIGSVEIVACVVNHSSIWAENTQYKISENNRANCEKIENIEVLNDSQNIVNPIYNWILANPILFPEPIHNVKGKLGFWNYEV